MEFFIQQLANGIMNGLDLRFDSAGSGLDPEHDGPGQFFPRPTGDGGGLVFEAEVLLEDYYRVRGWDPQTGVPKPETLSELGLKLS